LIHPGVQFKPVEGYPLSPDRDFGDIGAYLGVKTVSVHAKIMGGIPQPDEPRDEGSIGFF